MANFNFPPEVITKKQFNEAEKNTEAMFKFIIFCLHHYRVAVILLSKIGMRCLVIDENATSLQASATVA